MREILQALAYEIYLSVSVGLDLAPKGWELDDACIILLKFIVLTEFVT